MQKQIQNALTDETILNVYLQVKAQNKPVNFSEIRISSYFTSEMPKLGYDYLANVTQESGNLLSDMSTQLEAIVPV